MTKYTQKSRFSVVKSQYKMYNIYIPRKKVQTMDEKYTDIFLTIEDFNTMKDFLSKLLGGEYDDKVIRVRGKNSTRISNCAVMLGDDFRLGCSYEIEDGKYPDDYPHEDARIEVTGVVTVVNEYGARVLMTSAENIKIL